MLSEADKSLIGMSLDGFWVQVLSEVYAIDDDGLKTGTVQFLIDLNIAIAWAQNQPDPHHLKVDSVLVITDGKRYFLFSGREIKIWNDDEASRQARKAALAKLSPEERSLLSLSETA